MTLYQTRVAALVLTNLVATLNTEQLCKYNEVIGKYKYRGTAPTQQLQDLWKFGELTEHFVVALFIKQGAQSIEWSTGRDNQQRDIDVIVDGVSYSIKGKSPQYYTCPTWIFETERYNAKSNRWYDSWFYQCEADYFLQVAYGHNGEVTVYKTDRFLLQQYIGAHDFDRYGGLKKEVLAVQQGHNQRNTRIGLIERDTLFEAGISSVLYQQ